MTEQKQEIPEGYKQTEVGIIPHEWCCVPAHSVVDFFGGFGFSSRHSSVSGIRWLKIANVGINEIKWDAESYLPERFGEEYKTYLLAENDIVMALTRPILDNKLKISRVGDADLPALLNQRVARLKAKNSSDINYIYYVVQRSDFIAAMNLAMAGSDPPNIGTITLGQINIALPSNPKEQTAIANALSDVDALISELEKLIAKKQAIKTATMQQLLTGKTRLPEFALREDGTPKGYKASELGEIPEDWDVRSVYDLAENQKSLFDDGDWIEAEHITDKGIRLIQTGNIGIGVYVEKEAKKYIYESSFEKLKCKELRIGDLLICRLAEPAGRACIMPSIGEEKVITSVDVTIFRPINELADRRFLLQYFSSIEWFKSVQEQVGGTTHKRISRGALGKILIIYPSMKEQTAIAAILSDMDVEIQTLQQRLNKTRQIKQGMMQELLTGRVRLFKGEYA